MKIERSKTVPAVREKCNYPQGLFIFVFLILFFLAGTFCLGVTSKITRHNNGAEFASGETKDVVIGSKGTIQLGRAAEVIVEKFEDVWSINSIAVKDGTVFVGTSPNGDIYEYSLGKLNKIYPVESKQTKKTQGKKPKDINEPNDVNTVEIKQYLANEHVFAMAIDVSGRLLAGISGNDSRLMRLEGGKMVTIFKPEGAKYIFAITVDDGGDIYLGTGPEGRIYHLDSLGKNAEVIYKALDKNILSLAVGRDGFVYAGGDGRGLIYKINPKSKTATILYDSDQDEITGLLFLSDAEFSNKTGLQKSGKTSGCLYAIATSANIVLTRKRFGENVPPMGRPEVKLKEGKSGDETSDGGLKLNIANTKKEDSSKVVQIQTAFAEKGAAPGRASYLYKITSEGYVEEIFNKPLVLFALAFQNSELLIGTGNNAELFSVDPAAEQEKIIYADKHASQITAIAVLGKDIYLGTSNPAKLIKLSGGFAAKGVYTSPLIDAEQPAKWGKLQIEADIPQGCKIKVSSRSGNVGDVNDKTFSAWTEAVEITQPVQLQCPVGRFGQYMLELESDKGVKSPLIREVAVASTVPNLAPKVQEVNVNRSETVGTQGVFKISYKAEDGNGDTLIYKIEFRKVGRTNWIKLKDEVEEGNIEWDGKMVEDGRYEIRVTASDERSNTDATKLTDSRISEHVVVDNTGPVISNSAITQNNDKTVTLKFKAIDALSVIGKVNYTIDSNAKWIGVVPDDQVYDTTEEDFTIQTEKLGAGEHIITIKASDDVGNTTYKTFEVNING
jgi:hypothetical protein